MLYDYTTSVIYDINSMCAHVMRFEGVAGKREREIERERDSGEIQEEIE